MSDVEVKEEEFCLIPMKIQNGQISIFPLPQKVCHCRNSEKKHFSMYGHFNKEKTQMIPSNQEDMENFEKYCKELMENEP